MSEIEEIIREVANFSRIAKNNNLSVQAKNLQMAEKILNKHEQLKARIKELEELLMALLTAEECGESVRELRKTPSFKEIRKTIRNEN